MQDYNEPEEFHIGNRIKEQLAHEGRSITWLAQELGCTRDNLYKILRRKSLDSDCMFKISMATGYDFFKDCSDYLNLKKRYKLK